MNLNTIMSTYAGSDGNATQNLYAQLTVKGPAGIVAVNLLRASKCSERAKKYKGGDARGSYRQQAYQRKQYSLECLDRELRTHAEALGIKWGWGRDPTQQRHDAVLYVDLPTGQVSFHTEVKGMGPDYPGEWDGIRGAGASRIIAWAGTLFVNQKEETDG